MNIIEINDKKEKYIKKLNDLECYYLQDFVEFYKSKTGYFIDIYGDLKLPNSSIETMLNIANIFLKSYQLTKDKQKFYNEFFGIIRSIYNNGSDIFFVGD